MLDIETVAQQLGVSTGTVRNLVKDGQLRAYRIRTQYRFKQEDVDAYLAAQVIAPKRHPSPSSGGSTNGAAH